jgi:superfamily II DNA or RNA helicase
VVFAVSIRHSQAIVAEFREAGVAADHLDGSLPQNVREAILARLARGETQVVSNCAVLSEGWDLPECACCILARPTQSVSLYLQQVGRVLRPAPGKSHARIHDHAGCLLQHGLPDDPRDYRLTAQVAKPDPDQVELRSCPLCFRVYPISARHCPSCASRELPEAGQPPPTGQGNLVTIAAMRELKELQSIPERLLRLKGEEYLRLQEVARRKGYKRGWAYFRYRETFHEEPRFPPGFLARCQPASQPYRPGESLALLRGGGAR